MVRNEQTMYENLRQQVAQAQPAQPGMAAAAPVQAEDTNVGVKRALALGGAVLAGGLTGGVLASVLPSDEPVPEEPAVDEPVVDEPVVEEKHIHHHEVVHPKETYVIDEEQLMEIDGQMVVVATGTHNGEPMLLIDYDRDGQYDEMVQDFNNDGEITANEFIPISKEHIMVSNEELLTELGPVGGDTWTVVEEFDTDMGGEPVIAARAIHNGREVALIDVDRDGTYDYEIEDRNGDGNLTENEITDISDQGVKVVNTAFVEEPGNVTISDDPTVAIDYSTEARVAIDDEGNEVIAAEGTVDGRPAILVDANCDGTYDAAFVEGAGDAPVNIASAHIEVQDNSLVDNGDYINTGYEGAELDYVNTASNEEDPQTTDEVDPEEPGYVDPEEPMEEDPSIYEDNSSMVDDGGVYDDGGVVM